MLKIKLRSFSIFICWIFANTISAQDVQITLDWVKTAGGGSSNDMAKFHLRDKAGNHIIGGTFSGTADFDPGSGSQNISPYSSGSEDGFVLKLDADGNFQWVRILGGIARDFVHGLTLDDSGNIYAVGNFQSIADFDQGNGTQKLTTKGSWDGYLLKLKPNGDFGFVKQFGGTNFEAASTVIVNDSGIYVGGNFNGTCDFDPGAAVNNITSAGLADLFLVRLTHTGDLLSVKSFGGTANEFNMDIVSDQENNLVFSGDFYGDVDFDPDTGTYILSFPNANSTAIVKLNADGGLLWARQFLTFDFSMMSIDLVLDSADNIYLCGVFSGTVDFDPSAAAYILQRVGGNDGFIAKLSSNGDFQFARHFGGMGSDYINCLFIKPNGNILAGGDFVGTCDFNPTGSKYEITTTGDFEMSFLELNDTGKLLWAASCPTGTRSTASGIMEDELGDVYVSGYFMEDVDFDPSSQTLNINSTGGYDWFLLKLKEPIVSTHSVDSDLFRSYPNPAKEVVTIEYQGVGDAVVTILDMSGRAVINEVAFNNKIQLGVRDLATGTYILRIADEHNKNRIDRVFCKD